MAAIDVGCGPYEATYYGCYESNSYLNRTNPANDTGTLTSAHIAFYGSGVTQCKLGTFSGAPATYTPRDWDNTGAIAGGSWQTITGLSIAITVGDRIGFHPESRPGGWRYSSGSGSGCDYISGDAFASGSQTWSNLSTTTGVSLDGIGATAGWASIAKICGITSSDIAKICGVTAADIAKVNGVAV